MPDIQAGPGREQHIMAPQDVERSLDRLAIEIVERNHSAGEIAIVGIHTGGVPLAARIRARIKEREGIEPPMGSLDITLYRDDWSTVAQHPVVKKTDLSFTVEDRVVVLVDDVVFTGRTIRAAMDAIMDFGRPRAIQLASLIDRGGRELPVQPDYVGLEYIVSAGQRVDVLHPDIPEQTGVVAAAMLDE